MIKINNTETMGWDGAIHSIRNAMNSTDKGDSKFCYLSCLFLGDSPSMQDCNYLCGASALRGFLQIGKADMKLCKSLIKAGPSDRRFLRMIHVQADVTAPLYWWREAKVYRINTTPNDCFPTETILEKEFTVDDFSREHLDELPTYALPKSGFQFDRFLEGVVDTLNDAREMYLETGNKDYLWQMIQLLPSSFNQMCTIDLDYETLFSIYGQRKDSKLDEWVKFCKWIETLPYMKEFLGLDKPKKKGATE